MLCQSPIQVIGNLNSNSSMINSVDFHPTQNLFCATFTHNDQILFYQLEESGFWKMSQVLQNPDSNLNCPQHALYSKDGLSLVVSNWGSQTFNVYRVNEGGFCTPLPIATISYSSDLDDPHYRPHGMAFSPNGDFLAVAYGASKLEPRAVALYQVNNLQSTHVNFKLLSLLRGEEIDRGIPKGIAFSPDGSCLVLTFATTDSLAIYAIDPSNRSIIPTPRQVLRGAATQLCRPEDVKFTVNGNLCAISNSNQNRVTFYDFDKENNHFIKESPSFLLANPDADLVFPHGLAFSSNGKYLSVTQFGNVQFDQNDNLSSWAKERREAITVYQIE
jgi:6-phosphogluconolactonase (cycloisomerase 2 family)